MGKLNWKTSNGTTGNVDLDKIFTTDGGTMIGPIYYVGANNRSFSLGVMDDSDGTNVDVGWNYSNSDGAGLGFRSADHTTKSGEFNLFAKNSTGASTLIGKPDGSLQWNWREVERIDTINIGENTGYIKYTSGFMIQYGQVALTTSTSRSTGFAYSANTHVTFSIPFVGNPKIFTNGYGPSYNTIATCWWANSTTADLWVSHTINEGVYVSYVAIGWWK